MRTSELKFARTRYLQLLGLAAAVAIFLCWQRDAVASRNSPTIDVKALSDASICVWDVAEDLGSGLNASGWVVLGAQIESADGPVRFLAYDFRLEHYSGGSSRVAGMVPLDGATSAPGINAYATVADHFATDPSAASIWTAIVVSTANGEPWSAVTSPNQLLVDFALSRPPY